ncbi:hypothetical protein AB7M23_004490 [Pseudomonas sp. HLS-6 TE3448]
MSPTVCTGQSQKRGFSPTHPFKSKHTSRLACDGVGGVSVSSRCLYRGQARLLQVRGPCWSWLACDGVGGVSASTRRLHRGQDPLLQACAGSVGAGLPAMASVGSQRVRGACIAGKPGSYRLTQALLELACLRWRRWDVSEFAVAASRASPAPTGCAGSVGAGLPAMASVRCP